MSKYTFICSDESCEYKHGFSMNFIPSEENKFCDICNKQLKVVTTSDLKATNSSASIVSGVGDIEGKISKHSDFRDLMRNIKKGSPGSNMRDY